MPQIPVIQLRLTIVVGYVVVMYTGEKAVKSHK